MFLNVYHAQAAEAGVIVRNSGASIAAYNTHGRYIGSLQVKAGTRDIRPALTEARRKHNQEIFDARIAAARRASFANPAGCKARVAPMLLAMVAGMASTT